MKKLKTNSHSIGDSFSYNSDKCQVVTSSFEGYENPEFDDIASFRQVFYGPSLREFRRFFGNHSTIKGITLDKINNITKTLGLSDPRQLHGIYDPVDFATFFTLSSYICEKESLEGKTWLYLNLREAIRKKVDEAVDPKYSIEGYTITDNETKYFIAASDNDERIVKFDIEMLNLNLKDLQNPVLVYGVYESDGVYYPSLLGGCLKKNLIPYLTSIGVTESYLQYKDDPSLTTEKPFIFTVPLSLNSSVEDNEFCSVSFVKSLSVDSVKDETEDLYAKMLKWIDKNLEPTVLENVFCLKNTEGSYIVYDEDKKPKLIDSNMFKWLVNNPIPNGSRLADNSKTD